MQKYNNIKALFFLGIFSLLLLHQALPHLHHLHDIEHSHKNIAQSEIDSDHHDVPKKENSKKGFFDLFLEVHTHSVVSNEILVTLENGVKAFKVKKDIETPISVVYYSSLAVFDKVEKVAIYHPPNIYFNSYLASLNTRGPPTS